MTIVPPDVDSNLIGGEQMGEPGLNDYDFMLFERSGTENFATALHECRREATHVERRLERIIPFVFHRDGKQIKDYYAGWWGAIERAGLEDRVPHDFRRTAARNYVRAGAHEGVVMAILGHKTRSMFDRYNIVNEDDLERAAALVSKAQSTTAQRRLKNASRQSTGKRSPR